MTDASRLSRRHFLQRSALALPFGAATLGGCAAGDPSARSGPGAVTRLAPPDRVVTRRNIADLAVDDASLVALREAVAVMKARSARDPLHPQGWVANGGLHTTFCATDDFSRQVHYSWLVLPWHRAYLAFLERQLQAAIQEPTLALHYWDWTRHPRIPDAYWGDGNPLWDGTRIQRPGDTVPWDFRDVGAALRAPDFAAFGGRPKTRAAEDPLVEGALEQGPHNNVHNWTGGNMAGFVSAGYDALSYGHHGNVDRLWEAWRAGDPTHRNPTAEAWLGATFQFVGPDGGLVTVAVRDLVDTEALGYRFEDLTFADARTGAVVATPTDPGRPEPGGSRATLQFERLQLPALPLSIRVFVGSAPPAIAQGEAPDPADPAFVGTFTMLPIGQPDAIALAERVTIQMELRPEQLRRLGGPGAEPEVSFLPVPLKGRQLPTEPVRVRDVHLVVEP